MILVWKLSIRLKQGWETNPLLFNISVRDIAQPIVDVEQNVDIWIDRAVLHFLLEEHDIQAYFDNVKSTLSIGGYALFAEFSETGASKCAGLPVHRYSVDELSERLGTEFKLMHHEGYTFINPHGDLRSYLYTLYERQG